ncbi:MAG: hypothetical protein ACK4M6_16370, partial [Hyphomonas sp.]
MTSAQVLPVPSDGRFQRLAHHQGDGGGGLFLGADGQQGQALQTFGYGVAGLAPRGGGRTDVADGAAPVVGGLGRTQGLVDQPLAGQALRLYGGGDRGAEPGPDGLACDLA